MLKVYGDPAQTIEVKVGQEFIIALDENPTTGYAWQEEFDDSFLIVKHTLTESYPRTYKRPDSYSSPCFLLPTATL